MPHWLAGAEVRAWAAFLPGQKQGAVISSETSSCYIVQAALALVILLY